MDSLVHLKIVYRGEKRRIGIPRDQFNFSSLNTSLLNLFRIEPGEILVIKYQDEEKEWITVDSDQELEEALLVGRTSVLLLFLAIRRPHTATSSTNQTTNPCQGTCRISQIWKLLFFLTIGVYLSLFYFLPRFWFMVFTIFSSLIFVKPWKKIGNKTRHQMLRARQCCQENLRHLRDSIGGYFEAGARWLTDPRVPRPHPRTLVPESRDYSGAPPECTGNPAIVYRQQLVTLETMGWTDSNRNQQLLQYTRGDLQATVNLLLSEN